MTKIAVTIFRIFCAQFRRGRVSSAKSDSKRKWLSRSTLLNFYWRNAKKKILKSKQVLNFTASPSDRLLWFRPKHTTLLALAPLFIIIYVNQSHCGKKIFKIILFSWSTFHPCHIISLLKKKKKLVPEDKRNQWQQKIRMTFFEIELNHKTNHK